MKKSLCKALALILCFCILSSFSSAFAASVESEDDVFSKIKEGISMVVSDYAGFGFTYDEIETVYICSPIKLYTYVDGKLVLSDREIYPIANSDAVLFVALVYEVNGEVHADIQQTFSEQFTKLYKNNESIALIYDAVSCYVVTENLATKLSDYEETSGRDMFDSTNEVFSLATESDITFTGFSLNLPITTNQLSLYAVNETYALTVPYVIQTDSNICWAASIACIGNYLTNEDYTAKEVAIAYFGEDDWHQDANFIQSQRALLQVYDISYPLYDSSSAPTDERITTNISRGYPMFSAWIVSTGTAHATVIRGINTSSESIFIMDPAVGFYIAEKTGGAYSYTNAEDNKTLTMYGYISKY